MQSNICSHAAKRIKTLLRQESGRFSLSSTKNQQSLPRVYKCDQIRLSQIISQIDRLCCIEPSIKEIAEKQRQVAFSSCDPLTLLNQEVMMTQCCVNQKYMHCSLLIEEKSLHAALLGRNIQCGFREYFFFFKWLKMMGQRMRSLHASIHVKKYQIDVLKEEAFEENFTLLELPIKREERHFLMGHTIKRP
jgi:hypothetical protein